MATPNDLVGLTEDTTAVAEEWMYSNTFLVDLEESFNRWRLIELSLPDGHQLKLFLQNSLQATGKLRAIYLAQEEKRPDTEQQLRSWVSKVETQIGDEGKKLLTSKRWSISHLEPVVTTGMPLDLSAKSTASNGTSTNVSSNSGNVFVMEDYFSAEKPIEVLMASTCPQLVSSDAKSGIHGSATGANNATQLTASVRSASALASIGVTSSGLSGAVAKGTSSSSLPTNTHTHGTHTHASPGPASPSTTTSHGTTPSPVVGNHSRVPSKDGPATPSSAPPSTTTTTDANKTAAATNSIQSQFVHIVVEVNDLIMLVGQDAVLTFSLYADDKFITEEFPIVLPNQSPIILEDKAKRVVFRDLPIELLNGGSTVYLLAKIVRFGKMKYNEAKPAAKDSHEGYPVRRPYAMAVMALNEVLSTAQAEQDVADAMVFASDETLAAAKMATLRRRQFSSAPRPTLKDDFYDPSSAQPSSKHSKASAPFSSSNRPTSPPRPTSPGGQNRGKMMKDTLRSSALRAQAQAIDSLDSSSLASMRSMGHVRATDKFMTLYSPAPNKDDIFPDIHSYIINSLNDKSHYLTFLPKAKGLLVHISKYEGSFASVLTHPSFSKLAPISVCQTLFLPDQTSSSTTSTIGASTATPPPSQGSTTQNNASSTNSDMGFNFAPRNDLYVTIEEALLHDDKSFEILVEARNKFGNPASVSASSAQSLSSAASPLAILNSTGSSANMSVNSLNTATGGGVNAGATSNAPTTAVVPCPVLPLWANPPTIQGLPVSPFSAFQPAHIVHRCIPYHHKKDPKPMETFKMDLSRFSDVDHLYMSIRHVGESGKVSDPIAFGTLRLYQQDASFIPNGTRKLNTYKHGATSASTTAESAKRGTLLTSNSSGSSSSMPIGNAYASTPALVATKTGSGMISRAALGAVDDGQVAAYLKNEDQLPRSNKSDHITVSVNLVSTKITENIPLRALLNWQNSTAPDMSPLLEKCAHISRKDIVNFYKDIFDTLLELLVLLDDVRASAFQTLLAILATCQSDPRNAWYDQLDPRGHTSLKHWVDKYLEEGGLSNAKVWPILMDSLHKLIAAVSTDPKGNHKTLKLALKAAPMLIKFILRSRQLSLLNSSSTPSLPDYSASGTGSSRGTKSMDAAFSAKGSATRNKMSPVVSAASTSRGVSPIIPSLSNAIGADMSPSECFSSHGFEARSQGPDAGDATLFDPKQVSFNPLYNLPQVKMRGLFNLLGEDTNFRRRFLALLESFSSLLMINEPSLITLQALLVKAVPQMLQSAVFVLDRDISSRFIERFLTALDDADQLQLNIEKLLFLEHFQFSPYISLSILIKHIKMHARESEEERFIALRILKSMVRSILSQVFLGTLNATSPIAAIEAHPEDEMDAEYTSAAHLSPSSSSNARNGSSGNDTSPRNPRSLASAFGSENGAVPGKNPKPPATASAPTPSRPLFLVLLDLVPTLSRVMRKADETDAETRRDVVTIFLALLKTVSLTRLRQHLKNIKAKHAKSLLDALANIVLLALKHPVYPLGWIDLSLYQLRCFTNLLQHVLIPVVLQNFGGYPHVLSEVEGKIWTRLFCVLCYALRHPALQLESYVANRDAIISYLGGQDPRVVLSRGLWALWNRFEPFRMQLVPNAIPALLALSSSPNMALSKLARRCYLSLITREAQIVAWMNASHLPKFYRTVPSLAPNRPRVGSSSSSATGSANSQSMPIRMVSTGSNPSISGSPTNSPRSGTSPSNSSNNLLSGEMGETTRARSNNASAAGAPRPGPPKRSPSPIVSSGSSGNLASGSGSSRANVTVSGATSTNPSSGASSNPSRLSDSLTSSDMSTVPNLGLHGSISGSIDMPIQTLNSFGSAYSFASGNASTEKISFPRIEVATIQALEELSKSGAWSQKHFEVFFSVCRDLATTALSKSSTSNTLTPSTTRPSPRSASTSQMMQISAATLEQLYASHPPHPKALFIGDDSPIASLLPRPLVDAMSDNWAETSDLKFELPNLASKVIEFSTDMTSLVLLLASMRDLPQGAEYDEERAYALTQLMTYLRQTQHADAYLKYAYKLSKMYEEAGQYTEAAYAVLLHAEMLDWTDRVLPPMFAYAAVSASTRKQQLFCQAIALFDRGKAWENAIKVSSDLCVALRAPLYDYHELASQLRVQADLYIKIAEQERFFSNYFYVAYYGTGFPNALRRKKFIYRGLELERIPHFISRMSKKFPNAKIITSMDPTPSELNERRGSGSAPGSGKLEVAGSGGGQFLQIFTVQPSNENEMASGGSNAIRGGDGYNSSSASLGVGGSGSSQFLENMPEGTRKYHAANNVRVFQYSRPFKQPGAPKTTDENAFEHVWSAQVFVVTEDTFPNLQRRLEIVQVSEIVRSPLENATLAVSAKNAELAEIVAKISASQAIMMASQSSAAAAAASSNNSDTKVDRLSMALNGILDAAVNGGTAKYRGAFLSSKNIESARANRKLLEHISDLQRALMSQLQVVARGLSLHAELCPANLLGLQKRLESQYERMLEATTQVASRSVLSDYSDSIASPHGHHHHSHSPAPHSHIPHLPPAKMPPGGVPKGAMRVKDSDARPSIIGFAQRVATHDQQPQ